MRGAQEWRARAERVSLVMGMTAPCGALPWFDLNISGSRYDIAVGGSDAAGARATGDLTLRWASSTAGGG